MKLEEYEKRLKELEFGKLPWAEFKQKMDELQAEYLAEQIVPDAEAAIQFIREAQERGELPELDAPVSADDWENCQLLELNDNERPDNAHWRCEIEGCTIDVTAETGEVNLIFV
jgi:hypothetical protein